MVARVGVTDTRVVMILVSGGWPRPIKAHRLGLRPGTVVGCIRDLGVVVARRMLVYVVMPEGSHTRGRPWSALAGESGHSQVILSVKKDAAPAWRMAVVMIDSCETTGRPRSPVNYALDCAIAQSMKSR